MLEKMFAQVVDRVVTPKRSPYPESTVCVRLLFFFRCIMRRILVVSLAILPLMGCGPKRNQGGVVSGKITYKGTPVNGATLRLTPIPGPGEEVTIPVSQEGTFHTANIPPGEYKIVVEPAPTGAMLSVPNKGIDADKA